jgi:hypothetical protein
MRKKHGNCERYKGFCFGEKKAQVAILGMREKKF